MARSPRAPERSWHDFDADFGVDEWHGTNAFVTGIDPWDGRLDEKVAATKAHARASAGDAP
ncbi:hypothetical protein [Amycolatopsis sp. NPDC051128]|uniref:hypothetical protein n=1 Tax=Amycolatopsis sp. NPDC051128 TaxID=3155412 RepID=UPI003426AB3D